MPRLRNLKSPTTTGHNSAIDSFIFRLRQERVRIEQLLNAGDTGLKTPAPSNGDRTLMKRKTSHKNSRRRTARASQDQDEVPAAICNSRLGRWYGGWWCAQGCKQLHALYKATNREAAAAGLAKELWPLLTAAYDAHIALVDAAVEVDGTADRSAFDKVLHGQHRAALVALQDHAPTTPTKAKTTRGDEARREWVYKAVCDRGRTLKASLAEYKRLAPTRAWDEIDTIAGLRYIAKTYATDNGLPQPPRRQDF